MNIDINEINDKEGSDSTSPPVWFWIITSIALLWFLMDASAFFARVVMTDSTIQAMPENQRQLYQSMPLWVNIVFAFEVFGGVLGCIGLLLRKQFAVFLFYASIFGVVSQTIYIFFLSDAIAVMGMPAIFMPLLAILIGIGMIVYTKQASAQHWLS